MPVSHSPSTDRAPQPASPGTAPDAGRPPADLGWYAEAACAGMAPDIVFARRASDAAPALLACARCPVTRECEAIVDPSHTWFDGVSAGRLWHNGRPVDLGRGRSARARRLAGARRAAGGGGSGQTERIERTERMERTERTGQGQAAATATVERGGARPGPAAAPSGRVA
ncbi:WhiB family transcriptional regulator [Streptomyces lichenis]|uniref:WhiB family transcriptional regulator n=1 Tax=Streptomyces lichenis TaxID=2306967 RepID=A0ABT0IGE2_9ACTN|nr:WhiB family transcriptional regulator [Streptomyces lichenis]MCK8680327.1 WhiB family transcriptional regulator [Streptomyces lichenis]